MGCDIHNACTLYSKNTKEYIDVSVFNNKMQRQFPDIVGDRYYSFFGLFGNTARSYYPEMKRLEWFKPAFFSELYPEDNENPDWYGFSWCSIKRLRWSFNNYIKRLSDPEKFLDHDSDEYLDFKETGKVSKYTLEENEGLINYIKKFPLKNIEEYFEIAKDPKFKIICDLNGYDIDINKTIFTFWFDN